MTRSNGTRDATRSAVFRRSCIPGVALSDVDAFGPTDVRVSLDVTVAR